MVLCSLPWGLWGGRQIYGIWSRNECYGFKPLSATSTSVGEPTFYSNPNLCNAVKLLTQKKSHLHSLLHNNESNCLRHSTVRSMWTRRDNFTMAPPGIYVQRQSPTQSPFALHALSHTNVTFDHYAHFRLTEQTSEGVWQTKQAQKDPREH